MSIPMPLLCRRTTRIAHRTQWLSCRPDRQTCRAWSASSPRHANEIDDVHDDGLRGTAEINRSTRTVRGVQRRIEDVEDDHPIHAWNQDQKRMQQQRRRRPAIVEPESMPDEALALKDGEVDNNHFNADFYNTLFTDEKDIYRKMAGPRRQEYEAFRASLAEAFDPNSEFVRDTEAFVEGSIQKYKLGQQPDFTPKTFEKLPDDFSTMGDPDKDIAPDEEWADDDVSATAHGELDLHREMREYARLAAWEMPLLANLAIPFQPPTTATPLRWRYTTYMGIQHPAANKVVLTFKPADLDLSPPQLLKLIKIAGPRYNPHTETIKMSSEQFPTPAQNKRYLGDTFASLVEEAKNGEDKLADIPLDFRHARHKREKLVFPPEWRMTPERRAELDRKRGGGSSALIGDGAAKKEQEQEQQPPLLENSVVDGLRIIDEARMAAATRAAEMVVAQGGTSPSAAARGFERAQRR